MFILVRKHSYANYHEVSIITDWLVKIICSARLENQNKIKLFITARSFVLQIQYILDNIHQNDYYTHKYASVHTYISIFFGNAQLHWVSN